MHNSIPIARFNFGGNYYGLPPECQTLLLQMWLCLFCLSRDCCEHPSIDVLKHSCKMSKHNITKAMNILIKKGLINKIEDLSTLGLDWGAYELVLSDKERKEYLA